MLYMLNNGGLEHHKPQKKLDRSKDQQNKKIQHWRILARNPYGQNKTKLQLLVDRGSPRSFISLSTAQQLNVKLEKNIQMKQPKWANSDVSTKTK